MGKPTDPRFVGFRDEPPEGMHFACHALGRSEYDMWTNGKSLFDNKFRWSLVPRQKLLEE